MTAPLELRELQRWFARVVAHRETADVALRSDEAAAIVAPDEVAGGVIADNPRMSAAAMLQVYNGGYLARLVEVMQSDFGCVQHALGECAFEGLVAAYLEAFPSRHPNLNRLGREFPRFVAAQAALPNGPFLAELAQLELAVAVAFDAEEFAPLQGDVLASIPQEQWPAARFEPNPSLQLLAFAHPVDSYYQAWKVGEPADVPAPEAQRVAVFRHDDRVWRQRLPGSSYDVLAALVDGAPLADALASAAPGEPVGEWFRGYASDGLFTGVAAGPVS